MVRVNTPAQLVVSALQISHVYLKLTREAEGGKQIQFSGEWRAARGTYQTRLLSPRT
jgi:hypothetical protein